MLYVQTVVKIADNSGGFFGLCIRLLSNKKKADVGDAVVISVKSIFINKKLTHKRKRKVFKGTVRRAIVIRVAYQKKRSFNIFFKGSTNAVAILGNWGMPLANRVYGPTHHELKVSKYSKFNAICEGSF